MTTKILFEPANVRGVLAALPSLEALIPDPYEEGESSEAFPGVLRKTDRELYRWIANTHYPHLAEVVPTLERVHAAGGTFGHLVKTRDREQFLAHTAEILVAEDLLRRGYAVRTVPRSSGVTPDLYVTGEGIDLAVEVYAPRELVAMDEWLREVTDLASYVDVRANFVSHVETREELAIPPGPRSLDPWALADAIDRTRQNVLAEITHDVIDALQALRPLVKTYEHEGTPLRTTVELEDVKEPSPRGPTRYGTISAPGFGGYSPAGVFRATVEKVLKKASRRQTEGVHARARALVVYLMGTKVAEDLLVPAHFREASEVVDEIEPGDHGLDVIAFVVRALQEGLASPFTVYDDSTLTLAQVKALFA